MRKILKILGELFFLRSRQVLAKSAQSAAEAAKSAEPNDPYPFPSNLEDLQDYEAWEDEAGEMHIIRAQRLPSGDFAFPEGTVVSAPHTPCNSPVQCHRVCSAVVCRK